MNDPKKYSIPDLSALKIHDRARSRAGRRPWAIAAAVLLIAIVLLYAFVLRGNKAVVEVAAARAIASAEGAAMLNASGYVTPRQRATVAAKITGRVEEMLVEEGLQVQAGQVLARIDNSDAVKRLKSAEADLEVAKATIADLKVNLADAQRTLARIGKMQREGVSSDQELDRTQAAADSLKARLALTGEQVKAALTRRDVAAQDVENCVVRAPFAGIVVSKDAQIGEMVSPISAGGGFTRTGIATIVNMSSLEIEVDVNEAYIAKVQVGQTVDATLDAYPEWHIPSTVRTIIPTADRQKATVKVRITFDQLDPRILPDMGVKVTFLSSRALSPDKGSVLVKRAAVSDVNGQSLVFIVQDGRAQQREVIVGERLEHEIEIRRGLAPADLVVVSSSEQLRDGQRVEIKQ
jgi:RND family efflux transporter MFP subunit